MIANGFGVNTSDKEPSKSISELFEAEGAVEATGAPETVGAAATKNNEIHDSPNIHH